jgi:hypothetical protein
MSGPGSNCTRNGLMATVVVGLLLSPAFAKTQHDPKPPEDNAYFTGLLGVYANQGKAGYDILLASKPSAQDQKAASELRLLSVRLGAADLHRQPFHVDVAGDGPGCDCAAVPHYVVR